MGARAAERGALSDENEELHVVHDYPDAPCWHWHVHGQQVPTGTILRGLEVSGRVRAERAGDALDWLIHHGPMWECLDADEEFTITITPDRRGAT